MTDNISRRDNFAVRILAGMLSNQNFVHRLTMDALATQAVKQADELIKQLDERNRVKSSDDYWAFDPKAKEDAINWEADDA